MDDTAYAAFLQNMRDAALEDAVEVMRMSSAEAAALFEENAVDLVFIDREHSRAGCKADIEVWWPKLKDGAVMVGNDYSPSHFPGVVAAVKACFGEPDEVGGGGYPLWKVAKRADRWRSGR